MGFLSSLHLRSPNIFGQFSQNRTFFLKNQASPSHDLRALHYVGHQLQGLEYIGYLLGELDIAVEYNVHELDCLPAHGAFMAMANQSAGPLEELVLLYLLGTRRPTLRMAATARLKPLLAKLPRQLVAPPATQSATGRQTFSVLPLLACLHNDVPLLLFPGNEKKRRTPLFVAPAEDDGWHHSTGHLLKLARVPVVPVWVDSQRTTPLNWWGVLQPLLGAGHLPAELLSRRGHTVRVRVGPPVLPATLARLPTPERLPYLRARLGALGQAGGHEAVQRPPLPVPDLLTTIPAEQLEADIMGLPAARCLVRYEQWELYVAHPHELPHVLREIGRLRELALRRAGAGTEQASALDDYDAQHQHLVLYDRTARCLVGACRLGVGRAIMREQGRQGFYLHTLFRLSKALDPLLRQVVEVSRFFVREDYKGQPLPLALLWKGLSEYIVAHPEYGYLMGAVSISNSSSTVPKAEMLDYIQQNCFNHELAAAVRTRKRYRFQTADNGNEAIVQSTNNGLRDIQRLIAVPEIGKNSVPAPLRQYVRQHARFIGFTVDPGFSNALYGLLLLDARDLPARAQNLLERCAI